MLRFNGGLWKERNRFKHLLSLFCPQTKELWLSSYIHIYIHNWSLQPFSQDYGLASHTTHVVCVNFIRERRDLQFNVDSERQIFWETFSWQFYLLSEFLPEICWEEVAEEIFFFISFLMTDLGYEPRPLRLISQHTTY